MATIHFEIDGLPPSVNHAYHFSHKSMYMSKPAKEFKKYVIYITIEALKHQKWDMIPTGKFFWMVIDFEFSSHRFSDPNNMLKILIDSFEGYVFKNDKWLLPIVRSARISGRDYTKVTFSTSFDGKEV